MSSENTFSLFVCVCEIGYKTTYRFSGTLNAPSGMDHILCIPFLLICHTKTHQNSQKKKAFLLSAGCPLQPMPCPMNN